MRFAINAPTIISETIDGETVIINTVSGHYYTATGPASEIWDALCAGAAVADIVQAFDQAGAWPADSGTVEAFVDRLRAEQLIAPSAAATAPPTAVLRIESPGSAPPPTLTRHDDLQAIIELDPIHEVSPQMGWPFDAERS